MQNHYNLLYREDERELIPVARQYDVALTPYSPLASGHLTRREWDSDSVRATTDGTYKAKYEHAKDNDMQVVARVAKIAEERGVPMAHVALSWLWAKGCASVLVGCSKPARVDDAVAALATKLTADEVAYLEELYVPHALVGVMAQRR
jgi:aryl-alcohol dehydrogenase-like predicted oxidoreductase